MRCRVEVIAFLLAVGLAAAQSPAQALAQSPAPGQVPMQSPSPRGSEPDLGRMQQQETERSMPARGPLKITFGHQSAQWTPESLAGLPHTAVTVYNEHAKANQTYSGVPLIDLLAKLGVPDKPKGKQFKLYLVAEGSDGYKVVYSLGEVTPDVHDATVIVADSQDGKPIAEDGPLKLVATGEKRPARWVRNLVAVEVLTAQ